MNPPPDDRTAATYARAKIGGVRGSRAERAELRKDVARLFDAPSDTALLSLRDTFERIQGRVATPRQLGYLIHCWRIHGPDTERLLRDLYGERGTDQNLLLAVELAPPVWLNDEETGEGARAPDGDPGVADRDDSRPDEVARDDGRDASGCEPDDVTLLDPAGTLPTTERQESGRFAAASRAPTIWRCPVGRDHVQRTRADGSRYCGTCHP
jgi:hypothetical protein